MADDGRLDAAIDRVAREMLDVEPVAGLRERVLDRIAFPRRGPAWAWVAVPAAAAAIMVFAVLLQRSTEPTAARPGLDLRLTSETTARTRSMPDTSSHAATMPLSTVRKVRAAIAEEMPPLADNEMLPPLGGPPPIALQTIGSGIATPVTAIAVAPIDVQPIELNALPETPQERPKE